MNEEELIKYYNKFNEDKRLTRRHGIIEYKTAMKYIYKYLQKLKNPKIIDVGAGTGKYSIALANDGYDVVAVELVKHNLMTIKSNSKKVKAFLGNATNFVYVILPSSSLISPLLSVSKNNFIDNASSLLLVIFLNLHKSLNFTILFLQN